MTGGAHLIRVFCQEGMHYLRIGLIGDFSPDVVAHEAIPKALALSADKMAASIEPVWLPTVNLVGKPLSSLEVLDAFWCVPGSPYASMDGALRAIRYARERGVPFLGTCGGFQHAVIEYARNVLGLEDADHVESHPDAKMPIVSRLSCSLVEVEGTVHLAAGSQLREVYGTERARETYHCNFGLNAQYRPLFDESQMRITAVDDSGEPRGIELRGHPFFVATLFQPERSALHGEIHPVVSAFLKAAFRGSGIAAKA